MSAFPVYATDMLSTLKNWVPKLDKIAKGLGRGWRVNGTYTEVKSFDPNNTNQDEMASILATVIDKLKEAGLADD